MNYRRSYNGSIHDYLSIDLILLTALCCRQEFTSFEILSENFEAIDKPQNWETTQFAETYNAGISTLHRKIMRTGSWRMSPIGCSRQNVAANDGKVIFTPDSNAHTIRIPFQFLIKGRSDGDLLDRLNISPERLVRICNRLTPLISEVFFALNIIRIICKKF